MRSGGTVLGATESTVFPLFAAGAHADANQARVARLRDLAARPELESEVRLCAELGLGAGDPVTLGLWLLLLWSVDGLNGNLLDIGPRDRRVISRTPAQDPGQALALLAIDGSRGADAVARDLAVHVPWVGEGGFLVVGHSAGDYRDESVARPQGAVDPVLAAGGADAAVTALANEWILGAGTRAGWVELGPVGDRRVFWKPPRTTFVTMLYDIGRERWRHLARPMAYYLEQAERTLTLANPMVIHTEPKYLATLRAIRERCGLGRWTEWRCEPFEQTALARRYLGRLRRRWAEREYADEAANSTARLRPEYILLNWLKFEFLATAIGRSAFPADAVCWLDLGIHPHMLRNEYLYRSWVPERDWHPGALRLCQVAPLPDCIDSHAACACREHQSLAAGAMLVPTTGAAVLARCLSAFDAAVAAGWPTTEGRLLTFLERQQPGWLDLYPDTGRWENVFAGMFANGGAG